MPCLAKPGRIWLCSSPCPARVHIWVLFLGPFQQSQTTKHKFCQWRVTPANKEDSSCPTTVCWLMKNKRFVFLLCNSQKEALQPTDLMEFWPRNFSIKFALRTWQLRSGGLPAAKPARSSANPEPRNCPQRLSQLSPLATEHILQQTDVSGKCPAWSRVTGCFVAKHFSHLHL